MKCVCSSLHMVYFTTRSSSYWLLVLLFIPVPFPSDMITTHLLSAWFPLLPTHFTVHKASSFLKACTSTAHTRFPHHWAPGTPTCNFRRCLFPPQMNTALQEQKLFLQAVSFLSYSHVILDLAIPGTENACSWDLKHTHRCLLSDTYLPLYWCYCGT